MRHLKQNYVVVGWCCVGRASYENVEQTETVENKNKKHIKSYRRSRTPHTSSGRQMERGLSESVCACECIECESGEKGKRTGVRRVVVYLIMNSTSSPISNMSAAYYMRVAMFGVRCVVRKYVYIGHVRCTICNNNNFRSSCTRGGECAAAAAAVAAEFSALLVPNGTEHKAKNENNRMKMQPTSQIHAERGIDVRKIVHTMCGGWEFHCVAHALRL